MIYSCGRTRPTHLLARCALLLALALLLSMASRADDPYARSRDYDLQNVRTHLWLSAEKKEIRGEVTHSLSILRDDVSQLRFDSVDLKIEQVTVDGKPAKYATNPNDVTVSLDHPAKRGERH